ncbi:MAG TPA: FeoB small GTPase domain-containing protein, partial [Accumulibacter sp.]|nr:FeoB small GTPase domain-containing protein [Accumulibacter sp.]
MSAGSGEPRGEPRLALLGNPNCGKTALFNLLTGSRQKVANYPGVTVDRKEGLLTMPSGKQLRILDLPGAYSLNALSLDEEVTRDAVLGRLAGEPRPDMLVCVSDATNLKLNLRLVLEVRRLGLPMVLALNMTDLARKRGIEIDVPALARELAMPVVRTVAVKRGGAAELLAELESSLPKDVAPALAWLPPCVADVTATQREVRRILAATVREPVVDTRLDERIDRVVLHPFWGMVVLASTLFLMFQAVFSWASLPMEWIKSGVEA